MRVGSEDSMAGERLSLTIWDDGGIKKSGGELVSGKVNGEVKDCIRLSDVLCSRHIGTERSLMFSYNGSSKTQWERRPQRSGQQYAR